MTRQELWEAMLSRATVKLRHYVTTDPLLPATVTYSEGIISSIQMEDGSGHSFNVRLQYAGTDLGKERQFGYRDIHVRCPLPNYVHQGSK